MKSFKLKYRIAADRGLRILVYLFSFLALFPFLYAIVTLIEKGIKEWNFNFFTQVNPSAIKLMLANASNEEIPGGIINGIAGSFLIIAISLSLAIPLGVLIGIYVHDYHEERFARFIQYVNEIIRGIPSIIVGIIVYIVVVKSLNSYSALAAGISLAIIALPLIICATQEALDLFPQSIREAAAALGGSYISVLGRVVLPSIFAPLFSGILTATACILGETAPLLITSLGVAVVNWDPLKPTCSLTTLIWEFFSDPNMIGLAWGTSLLLFVLILTLNILAKVITYNWTKKHSYGQ